MPKEIERVIHAVTYGQIKMRSQIKFNQFRFDFLVNAWNIELSLYYADLSGSSSVRN